MDQKMWNRTFRIFGVGVLLCASSAFAGVNLTLTGAGNNGMLSGVYVGPYQGTVNGVSMPIICDDFYDDTWLNEAWTATASTFSDLSQTRFASDSNATTQYEQAAWLSTQLLNNASCIYSQANCAGDIQFAIWQVFDKEPLTLLTGNNLLNAQYWLNQAQSQTFTPGEFSDFTIYTPTSCLRNCGVTLPQEFIVRTPEPPELAILATDFSAAGGLLFWLYRRRTKRA